MNPLEEQATLAGTTGTGNPPTLKLFVGGHWIDSTATTTGEVRNPSTNEIGRASCRERVYSSV